jgi:hypothetical protein
VYRTFNRLSWIVLVFGLAHVAYEAYYRPIGIMVRVTASGENVDHRVIYLHERFNRLTWPQVIRGLPYPASIPGSIARQIVWVVIAFLLVRLIALLHDRWDWQRRRSATSQVGLRPSLLPPDRPAP